MIVAHVHVAVFSESDSAAIIGDADRSKKTIVNTSKKPNNCLDVLLFINILLVGMFSLLQNVKIH
jgi:hypothetical protein